MANRSLYICIHRFINPWMLVMSPLSLQREDSFITLDLNEIFSVLTPNFAFLPRRLMVSHSQGFRVSSLPSTFLYLTLQGFSDRVNYLVMARILTQNGHYQLMALHISGTLYHLSIALLQIL